MAAVNVPRLVAPRIPAIISAEPFLLPKAAVQTTEVTKLLASLKHGDRSAVADKLMPLVYDEFRALAARYLRHERPDHTLQPTALVHEAYLRLIDQTRVDWQGRTHFFAVGAQAIRRSRRFAESSSITPASANAKSAAAGRDASPWTNPSPWPPSAPKRFWPWTKR
jgi:hypothetical protein